MEMSARDRPLPDRRSGDRRLGFTRRGLRDRREETTVVMVERRRGVERRASVDRRVRDRRSGLERRAQWRAARSLGECEGGFPVGRLASRLPPIELTVGITPRGVA